MRFIKNIILLLFAFNVNSQSIHTIYGNVTNSKNELLFGNAIILNAKDSTFIKGTPFFDGKFNYQFR
jgi:hypothetical protein